MCAFSISHFTLESSFKKTLIRSESPFATVKKDKDCVILQLQKKELSSKYEERTRNINPRIMRDHDNLLD